MSDEHAAAVERLRPKLMAVAYRMLGTVADAEDAVQDAYLRYHRHAVGIDNPEGWLVKATTRLCIDRLRTARREEYVGPWLPEPVPEAWAGAVAEDRAELTESLSMAFLVLLETLTPAERAAYLLREVFGYGYDEIADLLDKTAENARQIAARAKKRLGTRERRFTPAEGRADALAERFFTACQSGDLHAIEAMLAADVVLYSDGGGKAFAARQPVSGVRKVANLLAVVFRKLRQVGELTLTPVNGRPGVVFTIGGKVVEVVTVAPDPDGGAVGIVYIVLNPDKLRRWPPSDAGGADRPELWEVSDGSPNQLRKAVDGAG
jgi:RNA polymerase sigma-70 factor (ECF subfamily)